jgi:lysozyme
MNDSLRLSAAGYFFLQESEAFSSTPYLDSGGVPTIGFGSTRYPSGKAVSMKDKSITHFEASEIFMHELDKYEQAVREAMPIELNQCEFDSLVSLCYNIGITAFKHSTLVKIADRKDGMLQEADQILRWNKDNGKEVKGLTNRRRKERAMFLGLPYE